MIYTLKYGKDYIYSDEREVIAIFSRIVFPIKDFFIAISLIWMYTA
jgi:hypothetical protein